jgi:hypothetical protein
VSDAAFQGAFARLVIDPDFRDDVRARGAAALTAELTDLERERLLFVSGDPGMDVTRTLHKGFRLGKLVGQLPLTCAALGKAALAREVAEFWRQNPPVTFYYLAEAIAFCDFLSRRLEEGMESIPYLAEVTAWERAGLELQRPRLEGEEAPLQVVEFAHDPLPLLAALGRGEPPAPAERPCLMIGGNDGGRIEWRLVEGDASLISV